MCEQQTQVSDSTQIQFDKLKKLSQFKGKKPWIHIKYKKNTASWMDTLLHQTMCSMYCET